MKQWRVILSVVVIFGAGMVTGGLLVRSQVRANTPVATPPTAAPGGPPGNGMWRVSRAQFVDKMHKQLDLTSEQCAQVDRIMKESHERMAKLWEPIAPQANEETCQARDQIRAILTPEQRVKFEEISKPKKGKGETKAKEISSVKECCKQACAAPHP